MGVGNCTCGLLSCKHCNQIFGWPSGQFHDRYQEGFRTGETSATIKFMQEIAELRAQLAEKEEIIKEMVNKAAANKLDGYRELGSKCAELECKNDELRAELAEKDSEVARLKKTYNQLFDAYQNIEAQLARCTDALRRIFQFQDSESAVKTYQGMEDIARECFDSLPKTAALDAEILRCAERISRDYNIKTGVDPSVESLIIDLDVAVRARKERE